MLTHKIQHELVKKKISNLYALKPLHQKVLMSSRRLSFISTNLHEKKSLVVVSKLDMLQSPQTYPIVKLILVRRYRIEAGSLIHFCVVVLEQVSVCGNLTGKNSDALVLAFDIF